MNKTEETVKRILADQLGLEAEDISAEDNFEDDLHMNSILLADFASELESAGYSVTPEDIMEFETVGELVEYISQEEEI